MDRSLIEHITYLERRITELSHQFMENRRTQEERNRLEAEIRVAELALAHYRSALELEGKLAKQ